ncbi:protein ENHANCED PSEUDOMONAS SUSCEPTIBILITY 1-like [Cicer arietinum]|uniref:Uncharacterized acetyltransferase At3g50280-like n=1 Tax=Cicer arietinum TaxID=3827 RepID=A0A1S2YSB6_CICAR|nr:uncharacterized acetyltransferase At3g50280-like [Cicer arietinum]
MAPIEIISTTTIQAPSNINTNSTQKIHLTPWDLFCLPVEIDQKGLLFHNPQNTKDTLNQINHLKNTLSSTLAFFPSLTGRLIINHHQEDDNNNNNTTSCFILCNNVGALFIHALAQNTSVSDILKPNYVPSIVHSFFPLNKVRNYEGTSKPLLAIQVTELVDGIFIGVSINHVVVDGNSLWHFINSWAEISRGFHQPSKLPTLNRWFYDGTIETPIKFSFAKDEKQNIEIENSGFVPELPRERIFHFTKEKIAKLKSKANEEANTNKISSLQALLTHLWQAMIRCQNIDPEEEIMYSLPIGVRGRTVPPLPENYFGNALEVGVVKVKAKELLVEGGFGKVALEMNKVIGSHCGDNVKRNYECWVKNPVLLQSGALSSVKALATSSSPRFDVYGNDFGWGKPVAVRGGGGNRSDGTITLFSGLEEGSIDVEVCLSYHILEAMGNLPQFIHVL